MKILIVFYHPAHVHTFKNVIKGLEHKGHEFKALAIEKEITTDLLDLYDIEYEIIGESRTKKFFNIYKVPMYFKITYNIWKIAKKIQPDLLLGRWNLPMAQISKKLDIPYISFFDSDQKLDKKKKSKVVLSSIPNLLPRRSDIVFTPSKNKMDFQNKKYVIKHIKLPTYKELAYLHPNQFLPDKSSLIDHGIDPDEKFSLVRFVEWEAWHDVGKEGFNSEQKIKLVKKLEENSKVYISGEGDIPYELKDNKLAISVDKIHNLLYHANLFIGDSQTMATEAAILGVPTIRCNTFVGERDMTISSN